MRWKETRKRDTNWRRGLPSQAVCLIELRDEAAEPLLVRTQDLCRRVQRLLGPPDPASKRLNLREVEHFPRRYQNMLRLPISTFRNHIYPCAVAGTNAANLTTPAGAALVTAFPPSLRSASATRIRAANQCGAAGNSFGWSLRKPRRASALLGSKTKTIRYSFSASASRPLVK